MESTPALVHGGPFANIAHGCNSVLATRLALKLGDICLTEAGFATDLGAEKFFDIKCRLAGLKPDAAMIVATARALKYHGGVPMSAVDHEDLPAIKRGMANLEKHVEDIHLFGVPVVVALNRFPSDTDVELAAIVEHCAELGIPAVPANVFGEGGAGGERLASALVDLLARQPSQFRPLYDWAAPVKAKIHTIATRMYGAERVAYTKRAEAQIAQAESLGYGGLPICMAKTQRSLSDDPTLLGRPRDFTVTVGEVRISAGAGFLVPITGDILTMPGLPRVPAVHRLLEHSTGERGIDVIADGGRKRGVGRRAGLARLGGRIGAARHALQRGRVLSQVGREREPLRERLEVAGPRERREREGGRGPPWLAHAVRRRRRREALDQLAQGECVSPQSNQTRRGLPQLAARAQLRHDTISGTHRDPPSRRARRCAPDSRSCPCGSRSPGSRARSRAPSTR